MDQREYIEKFNSDDFENVINAVPNSEAYGFLHANAPFLTCPDKDIEEVFAFRTWTLRKHFRKTEYGMLMSEFLPSVPWAGAGNTVGAPLFHHLNEVRWWKNSDRFIDYIDFFLTGKGDTYRYHTPALTAMCAFFNATDNFLYAEENIEKLERYFDTWEKLHRLEWGLYWSDDNHDAMEFSISGTSPEGKILRGVRPTLNSYMYGDARALAQLENMLGRKAQAGRYEAKAAEIKYLAEKCLWDGTFFKAIHSSKIDSMLTTDDIEPQMNVRELIGFIPWEYGLASPGKENVFRLLADEKVFAATTGLATADMSHPRFMYQCDHECLWNGYVWPFATSQTLNAVIALKNDYRSDVISDEALYGFIRQYARMHRITEENGYTHCFIDEVMHPFEYKWTARDILMARDQKNQRGKDYNHSTFCDLVIRGLIGVVAQADTLTVNPRIVGIWDYFSLENITFKKQTYDIFYDADGTHFNKGAGVRIVKR